MQTSLILVCFFWRHALSAWTHQSFSSEMCLIIPSHDSYKYLALLSSYPNVNWIISQSGLGLQHNVLWLMTEQIASHILAFSLLHLSLWRHFEEISEACGSLIVQDVFQPYGAFEGLFVYDKQITCLMRLHTFYQLSKPWQDKEMLHKSNYQYHSNPTFLSPESIEARHVSANAPKSDQKQSIFMKYAWLNFDTRWPTQ